MLIVLDAGHGGSDPGASGNGLIEKILNLEMTKRIGLILEQYECEIIYTRLDDKTMSLKDRSTLANDRKADFYLSIHANASGGSGFESFIFKKDARTAEWQTIIHDAMMNYLSKYGVKDRGKKRENFHVLRETKMPAILIENLFVDHPADALLLKKESFNEGLAEAIASGIVRALRLERKLDWKKESVQWLLDQKLLTDEKWIESADAAFPLYVLALVVKRLHEQWKEGEHNG